MAKKPLAHPLPHKFVKKNIGSVKPHYVFKCILPGCPTYYRTEIADGMESICHGCGAIAIVRKNITTPICDDCKYPVRNSEIIEVLERLVK